MSFPVPKRSPGVEHFLDEWTSYVNLMENKCEYGHMNDAFTV